MAFEDLLKLPYTEELVKAALDPNPKTFYKHALGDESPNLGEILLPFMRTGRFEEAGRLRQIIQQSVIEDQLKAARAQIQAPPNLAAARSTFPGFPAGPTQQMQITPPGPGRGIEQLMDRGFIGPGPAIEAPMSSRLAEDIHAPLEPYQRGVFESLRTGALAIGPGGQIETPSVASALTGKIPTQMDIEKHRQEMEHGALKIGLAQEDRYHKAMENALLPDKLIGELDKARLERQKLEREVRALQPGSPEQVKLEEQILHLRAETQKLMGETKINPVVQTAFDNAIKQARASGLQIGGDLGSGMVFGQNFNPQAFARYLRAQIVAGMAPADRAKIEELAKNYDAIGATGPAGAASPGTAEDYLKSRGVQ